MPRTLSLTLLAIAFAAAAEESPTIIVTAERGDSELARSAVSVEVIEAKQIRDRGYALNQADWLRELPGVTVLGTNGGVDGGTAKLSLRGVDPSFNAMLIDGIPLGDASSIDGLINPAVLNPAGTGRIEVLKGAQSGLYGGGAVGGVINLISARPTSQGERRVRIGGGSFRTGLVEAQASGPAGKGVGYALGATGLSSAGISTTTDSATSGDPAGHEADGVRRFSAIGRVELKPTQELMLYGAGLSLRGNQEFDAFPPPTYMADPEDAGSHMTSRLTRLSSGGEWKHGATTLSGDLAKTWIERVTTDSSNPGDDTYSSAETWLSLRIQQRLQGGFRLGAGVDDRRSQGRQVKAGSGTIWDDAVGQHGAYGLLGWSGTHGDASVTGRVDRHDAFGKHSSGRAAAAIFTEDLAWKLRTAIGNGFVAPTLYQLHGQFPPYSFAGNPDLEPQTALQFEVGADASPVEGVTLSATVFRTMYDRRISYFSNPVSPWNATYINGTSDEDVRGVEAGAGITDIASLGLDLEGWYTHLDSNDGTGKPAYYTPEDSGGVRLTARQNGNHMAWWESAGVQANQGIRSFGAYVGTSAVVSLAAGVLIDRRWEAVLRIDNALDQHYETTPGYTTVPRSAYLSLGAKF